MTEDYLIVALIGIAVVFFLFWPKPDRRKKRKQDPARKPERRVARRPVTARYTEDDPVPANAIVVDGSNVMHWGGDPSAPTIAKVVDALENKGFAPIVIFDASVGYRLSDRYMNERTLAPMINMAASRVYVVHKGVVADEVILDFATTHDLRIVTNDRYKDWSVQFPLIKKKGRLVKGTVKEGSVMLNGI